MSGAVFADYCQSEKDNTVWNEAYYIKLFRRAILQHDLWARNTVQKRFHSTVLAWVQNHPNQAAACELVHEDRYVSQAFALFWLNASLHQMTFDTLSDALKFLYVSLNSVILDQLRLSTLAVAVPSKATNVDNRSGRHSGPEALWSAVQTTLPDVRHQRLAYLLFHCGLKPSEIIKNCPREFSDIQEIYQLRHHIMNHLLQAGIAD